MATTAVEWIEGYLKQFNHVTDSLSLTKAFEKAKKMEAEQKKTKVGKTAVEWIEGYLKQFNHVTGSLSLTKAFEKAKIIEKGQKK